MLRIIILHWSMSRREFRLKGVTEHFNMKWCIHFPLKNTDSSCASLADSSLHVDLDTVFWPWFQPGLLIVS